MDGGHSILPSLLMFLFSCWRTPRFQVGEEVLKGTGVWLRSHGVTAVASGSGDCHPCLPHPLFPTGQGPHL